ncbi:DUF2145 domain-containing protein [Aliishimia ponticola]|uniref:DUF2145 domain-containing protein n=2 Tax=Aliishimia ponticola TaxID=2499833 RepID=A0A4S4NJI9_9RHOB|nr:DUF2145 domain-containing protein [Aliishimia ponticola]
MAGSSEATKPVLPPAKVARFADQVQQELARRGTQVAIVARMGRDPSVLPKGVRYTHVAYWVYSDIQTQDGQRGKGYRVFNLYQTAENAARSTLVQDSPADFLAGAKRLEAGIIIPDRRLQRKLAQTIASPTYAALHNPRYSVLANPASRQFQNCTEHTLDVLMAALYGVRGPDQIKANIAAHFTPQPIPLGGLKRGFASLTSAALTTQDHGASVATATFGSIAGFMQKHDLAQSVFRLTP